MAFLFLYWNNRNNLLAFTLSKTPGLILEWGNSVSKHNYPPTLITQRGQEVSSHRIITRSQLPRVIQTMSADLTGDSPASWSRPAPMAGADTGVTSCQLSPASTWGMSMISYCTMCTLLCQLSRIVCVVTKQQWWTL